VIECAGAPRDLGRDQGAACRALLGQAWGQAPRWQRLRWRLGVSGAECARTARDVARHFPRQAETLEGMARAAGVPRAWLVDRLARIGAQPALLGRGCGVAAARTAAGPFLAIAPPARWLLRRARPEGGIACLELAPPWFGGAVAALSEAGVAAAVVPLAAGSEPLRCAAPAALLVQDALHRTESLSGAIEWCLRRPAGGRATLLFADASGEAAGLRIEAGTRRLLRPADGLLVEAPSPQRAGEIAKTLRDASRPGALADALEGDALRLDPALRSLSHWRRGAAEPDGTWLLGR
jgi:hypothetical protein